MLIVGLAGQCFGQFGWRIRSLATGPPSGFRRKMKKHSHEEILLKLVRADELARAGNSQVAICKALGVSVMTLHRWRKLPVSKDDTPPPHDHVADGKMSTNSPTMDDMRRVLEELTLENQRLRKIVTDLLLEKMMIEEASAAAPRVGQARKA
jgi:putative transposase